MYQALYRKWRPKTFDDVVGQDHITDTLKNQVMMGKLSHAYLFIGSRGTGKTTCARILAKAVNCENPVNGNPCCKCATCRGIDDGSIMDIVEMDAASNNGVDNVRALREEAVFSPATTKKRVYIIDEVHMLSLQAFNALLKIIEEPPEHLMFILATTELNKVPTTILSRCQRYTFKRLKSEKIAEHVKYVADHESFTIDPNAALLLAQLSEGGMRDALSSLDQCSVVEHITVDSVYSTMGLAGSKSTVSMMSHVLKHDIESAIKLFNDLWIEGKNPSSILNELNVLQRDILITSVTKDRNSDLLSGRYDVDTLSKFAKYFSIGTVSAHMQIVQDSLDELHNASSAKTVAELCLVKLCNSANSDDLIDLKERIIKLENIIQSGKMPVNEILSSNNSVNTKEIDKNKNITNKELPDTPVISYNERVAENFTPYEEPEYPDINEDILVPSESDNIDSQSEGPCTWNSIIERALPNLPPSARSFVGDNESLSGTFDGDSLKLYAQDSLVYNQINKPKVLECFKQAALELSGRPIAVTITESKNTNQINTRSIEELKQFREVHIIGGK